MALHYLFGCFWGGDDEGRDLTKLYKHERSMFPCQISEGPVRQRADEVVDASDDGELPWSWGQFGMGPARNSELQEQENEDQDREGAVK